VPAIVGLGEAAAIAGRERATEQPRIRALRDRLETSVCSRLPGVEVNGHLDRRLGNTSNLSFPGLDGEALMKAMPDVAASSSSACTSALLQPSYVLGALGYDDDRIRGSIRFSLGRFTTTQDVETAVERVVVATGSFRKTVRRGLETR